MFLCFCWNNFSKYLAPHRADGGVCKNNFVMQMTSDLINETIERPAHTDMSCLGAASLAGLAVGMCGFYKNSSCLASYFLQIAFLLPHKIIERIWRALVFIKLHTYMHTACKTLLQSPRRWVLHLFHPYFTPSVRSIRQGKLIFWSLKREDLWVTFWVDRFVFGVTNHSILLFINICEVTTAWLNKEFGRHRSLLWKFLVRVRQVKERW